MTKPKPMRTTNMLLLASLFTLAGCQKEPTACFKVEGGPDFIVNEEIKLTNCSEDGYSYLWTFPDGQTFTDENMIGIPQDPGHYKIILEAFSRNKRRSDKTSESFLVTY